jgi:hypothetical protein
MNHHPEALVCFPLNLSMSFLEQHRSSAPWSGGLQDPGEINYMKQQGIGVDNNQNTQAKCNCNIARQEFHTRACFFSLSSLLISGVLGSSSFISLSKSLISLQHPHAPINSAPLFSTIVYATRTGWSSAEKAQCCSQTCRYELLEGECKSTSFLSILIWSTSSICMVEKIGDLFYCYSLTRKMQESRFVVAYIPLGLPHLGCQLL